MSDWGHSRSLYSIHWFIIYVIYVFCLLAHVHPTSWTLKSSKSSPLQNQGHYHCLTDQCSTVQHHTPLHTWICCIMCSHLASTGFRSDVLPSTDITKMIKMGLCKARPYPTLWPFEWCFTGGKEFLNEILEYLSQIWASSWCRAMLVSVLAIRSHSCAENIWTATSIQRRNLGTGKRWNNPYLIRNEYYIRYFEV